MKSFTRFYGGVSIPDPDAEAYLLAAGITDDAMKAAPYTQRLTDTTGLGLL